MLDTIFYLLEPLICFAGIITLMVLAACGVLYVFVTLVRILWKPVLIGSAGLGMCFLLYVLIMSL